MLPEQNVTDLAKLCNYVCKIILDKQKHGKERTLRQVYDYSIPNVSGKVVRIILSYTDYVNRGVWNI